MIKSGTLCRICKDKNGNIWGTRKENAYDITGIEENQLVLIIKKQSFNKFKITSTIIHYECLIDGNIFIVSEDNLKLV